MNHYSDREAACLFEELKHVYPELAPPKEKQDAELDKIDLFGPEETENEEAESCRPSKD